MTRSTVTVSFVDAAIRYNKDRSASLPAALTVAELQTIMAGNAPSSSSSSSTKKQANAARFVLTLPDGSVPSGAATLGDLAAAFSHSPALTLTVAEELAMGVGCDCCVRSMVANKQQEMTDYYSHVLAQQLGN